MSQKGKPIVMVIKPLKKGPTHQPTVGDALITIDGVLVGVKVHRRAKHAGMSTDPFEGPGTWTAMRFDNPEIRKHSDYKAIWKEVFFALELNWNERGYGCKKRELQREWRGTWSDECDCEKCKAHEKKEQQQVPESYETSEQDEDGSIPF